MRVMRRIAPTLVLLLLGADDAESFAIDSQLAFPCHSACVPGEPTDVPGTLAYAPRWTASPGPGGTPQIRIQVGVSPSFVESLGGTTPELRETMREAVLASFAAWETSRLRFEVTLDDVEFESAQISVTAVDQDHYLFAGTTYTGVASLSKFDGERLLTNGARSNGPIVIGAHLFLNFHIFELLFGILLQGALVEERDRGLLLQHFLMHEVGHAIGLGHPNQAVAQFANFDDDDDPFTRIEVDPSDPFAGIGSSPNADPNAIMHGGFPAELSWFTLSELQPDDLSGRDVLYPTPVPEPLREELLVAAALTLCFLEGRRVRVWRKDS